MRHFKASIIISKIFIAEHSEEAKEKAEYWQEEMAGSNDGSEMLANAPLQIEQI